MRAEIERSIDPVPSSTEPSALQLIERLCAELDAYGVAYCHWKSNDVLERALSGESDLDLLVHRGDARRFEDALERLGFRVVEPPPLHRVPNVFHAYGVDPLTGRLAHIHAHYELVLGDDTTKNYRLPIEEAYLASAERRGFMPVPAAEPEFAVFVIRMVLKHCTWDATVFGKGRLSASEVHELMHLIQRADDEGVGGVIDEHLPMIGRSLFDRCLWSLRPGTSRSFGIRTAHFVERALGANARRRPGLDAVVRSWRRMLTLARRHVVRRPSPRARLGSGSVVAIVGGDGSGKTTVVADLSTWLSGHVTTATFHLGKPRPSIASTVMQVAWRGTARHVMRGPSVSEADLSASDGSAMSLRAKMRLARQVMVARDRVREHRRARRVAARGGIAIADRFPLVEIELMDGPLAGQMVTTAGAGRLVRFLARREQAYYARIGDPDILIVLRVSPDVAAERRRGIDAEQAVRRRSEEIRDIDWSRLPAVVIDADRPMADVLREVRSAVWSRI